VQLHQEEISSLTKDWRCSLSFQAIQLEKKRLAIQVRTGWEAMEAIEVMEVRGEMLRRLEVVVKMERFASCNRELNSPPEIRLNMKGFLLENTKNTVNDF